jgi:DNA-binding transcriptional ArsR family regulator
MFLAFFAILGAVAGVPVGVEAELAEAPGTCVLPLASLPCPVGFDDPSPGLGDETLWVTPVVQRADVRAEGLPLSLQLEDGSVLVPSDARGALIAKVQALDDAHGDFVTTEEAGRSVVIVGVRVPGYKNADNDDQLVVPVITPVLSRDGIYVPFLTEEQSTDDTRTFAEITAGCHFEYTLPDDFEWIICVPDPTPVVDVLLPVLPEVVVNTGFHRAAINGVHSIPASEFLVVGVQNEPSPSSEPGRNPTADLWSKFLASPDGYPWSALGSYPLRPGVREDAPVSGFVSSFSRDAPIPWLMVAFAAFALTIPLLRLYRRMVQKECLTNELRTAILREVRHEPGVQPAELARRLECSFKTVQHHLRVLQEFGHVDLERRGWSIHVFERGVHPKAEKGLYLARHPTRLRVLRAVAAQPGARCRDVARALGMGSPGVHSHLKALEREGVLRRDGVRWHLAPEAEVAWGSVQRADAVGPVVPAG